MKKSIKNIIIAVFCVLMVNSLPVSGQVLITSGTAYTQNFTIGATAGASLPDGFRVDKNTGSRVVGTYGAAAGVTENQGGNNLSTTAGNGIYNFGAGAATTATDRAVGFLSSASATKSGNLYVQLQNTGATTITQLNITYNVEKYRNGSNAAGFRIQLYTSTDDVTYTPVANGDTPFTANTDNTGFASAPGVTVPEGASLAVSIPQNANYYLAFNYSVITGTTTSNAQALAIDDLVISPTVASAAPVSISGRVNLPANNLSLRPQTATVTLTDSEGVSQSVRVGRTGNFRFTNVLAGQQYILTVDSRGYTFEPRIVVATEDITDLDFAPNQ